MSTRPICLECNSAPTNGEDVCSRCEVEALLRAEVKDLRARLFFTRRLVTCDCQFGHMCDYHAEQQDRRRAERDAALEGREGAVTAPLTHATVRGLAWLRGQDTGPEWVRACEGVRSLDGETLILLLDLSNTIPTCPHCAVLRDAALEGREEGSGSDTVA